MTTFTAAVVQAAPVVFDAKRTLDKLRDLAADAARTGAKLAVFPEDFVSAYPKGLDFGARVGMRAPEGRDDFRRYWESAIEVLGPAAEPSPPELLGHPLPDQRIGLGGLLPEAPVIGDDQDGSGDATRFHAGHSPVLRA